MLDACHVVPALVHGTLENLGFRSRGSKWTVIAGIAAWNEDTGEFELLSLGTGVKCLPDFRLASHRDSLIHDGHAEVVCRRSFMLFLFGQLSDVKTKKSVQSNYLVYDPVTRLHSWNPSCKLVMYTSHSPCGDATMTSCSETDNTTKRLKTCVQEGFAAGRERSCAVGILRTKPSRGDCPFSSSMSCSDKIASWNIVGIQGALLAQFLNPVYLDGIVIGDAFEAESVERALKGRTDSVGINNDLLAKNYRNNSTNLHILQSCANVAMPDGAMPPDDCSYFWFRGETKLGSIVLGYKKGAARPKAGCKFPTSLQSPLSRECMFEEHFKQLRLPDQVQCGYEEAKLRARDFQSAKLTLLQHPNFCDWIVTSSAMKTGRMTK